MAPRRLREATVVTPWKVSYITLTLTQKIETLHGCVEGIVDSLWKRPLGSCGCTGGLLNWSRLREGSEKAPLSNRGGAGASTKWMRRDGVTKHSRGLRRASVVARGTTMATSGNLRVTGNSSNNDRPSNNQLLWWANHAGLTSSSLPSLKIARWSSYLHQLPNQDVL